MIHLSSVLSWTVNVVEHVSACNCTSITLLAIIVLQLFSQQLSNLTSGMQIQENMKAIDVIPLLTPTVLEKIEAVVQSKPKRPDSYRWTVYPFNPFECCGYYLEHSIFQPTRMLATNWREGHFMFLLFGCVFFTEILRHSFLFLFIFSFLVGGV